MTPKKKDLTPGEKPKSDMAAGSPDYKNTVKLPSRMKADTKTLAPAGTAAEAKQAPDGRAHSGRNQENKPRGEKSQSNKPQGDKSQSSKQHTAKPQEEKPQGSKSQGEKQRTAKSQGIKPQGDKSLGIKPQGGRPQGGRPQGGRSQDYTPRTPAPEMMPVAVTRQDDDKIPDFYLRASVKPKNKEKKKGALRVIPLGGLCEIGKNMTLLEFGNDIIIIDCGMAFPEETMPGIDAVIQDYTYVLQNKDRVRGIFITHGHEDHIGALPYLMKDLKCPIYAGRLAIELIRGKLAEKGAGLRGVQLQAALPGDTFKGGNSFSVEFIHVNHSIADAFALAIKTPVGVVIHTGDFKVDYTPIDGGPIDLQRFSQYGKDGVLLLLDESTNIEIPGMSPSERSVGESFQRIIQNAPGRVIVATFSSHVHRMQQIFTAAEKYGRKVALVGRSMLTVFAAANSLGYIEMKPDTLIDINDIDRYQPEQLVILTTGSQAEPMSALTRMAFASHKIVEITQGDTVIVSAHPIPGNEKPIYKVINELFRRGAKVIYEDLADVHVSGHAFRGEHMLIHELVKPKYFIPVHGEYRMLFKHAQLARDLGMSWNSIFILNNGDIFECTEEMARISGYINAAPVLIDGSGIGDIDNRVLRDRKLLSDDGVVAISLVLDKKGKFLTSPSVQAVGFLYESESAQVIRECSDKITSFVNKCAGQNRSVSSIIESGQLRDYVKSFLFEKTRRRPMILISVTIL